jgi:hypothetical protein
MPSCVLLGCERSVSIPAVFVHPGKGRWFILWWVCWRFHALPRYYQPKCNKVIQSWKKGCNLRGNLSICFFWAFRDSNRSHFPISYGAVPIDQFAEYHNQILLRIWQISTSAMCEHVRSNSWLIPGHVPGSIPAAKSRNKLAQSFERIPKCEFYVLNMDFLCSWNNWQTSGKVILHSNSRKRQNSQSNNPFGFLK